jgi:hypothetical protein
MGCGCFAVLGVEGGCADLDTAVLLPSQDVLSKEERKRDAVLTNSIVTPPQLNQRRWQIDERSILSAGLTMALVDLMDLAISKVDCCCIL